MGVAGQQMYHDGDLNLEATELRLGLPEQTLSSSTITITTTTSTSEDEIHGIKRTRTTSEKENTLSSKTQIVGWPPVPSFRKNHNTALYVKVDMDGIPYLRKIDLKGYLSYGEMVTALERMFKVVMWDDYIPTYEDKDGDWMLAGDVPWEMFVETCKRLRIVKSSDAKGIMGYL